MIRLAETNFRGFWKPRWIQFRVSKSQRRFWGTVAVGVLLAWLGGYNFDHRDVWVSFYALCNIVIAFLAAEFPD